MPVTAYSLTPASNNGTPPNGAPEGMAPGDTNDILRQIMSDVALEAQKNSVKVLGSVSGTNTITASMSPALASYTAGMFVVFTPANNCTGATTLNINSLGALDILKADGDALVSGDLLATIPALLVLDAGADDWILMNPQTHNMAALVVDGAVTINGALTTDNTTSDEPGFKGKPQNSQSGNYTLVLADAGKHIAMNGTTITLTVPANASVSFPSGTQVDVFNSNSTSLSIAITSDSMILAGTGTTGTRTLAQNGWAQLMKIGATTWTIKGEGLT